MNSQLSMMNSCCCAHFLIFFFLTMHRKGLNYINVFSNNNRKSVFIFLGITATIMFLAFVMDLVVWSKAHRIDITPEDNGQKKPPDTDCQKQMPASPDNSV